MKKEWIIGILLLLIALVLLLGCINQQPPIPPTPTPTPPIQQQPTQTPSTLLNLSEAIREQVVKAEIRGTGDSSGDSILLKLTCLVPRTVQINIPIGTVLISDDPSVQSMVIRKVKGIAVGAMRYQPVKSIILDSNEPREYVLEAYCLDFHKENPSKESTFWVSPNPANSEIIDVLKTADRLDPEIATVPAIQTAIWALTEDMSEDELKERFRVTPEDIENAKAVLDTAGFEAKTFRLYTPPSPTPVPTPSPGDGTSFDSPKLLKANTKLPVELQTPKGAAHEATKEFYLYITDVKPGQKVVVKARVLELQKASLHQGYEVSLYNEEREKLVSDHLSSTGSFTLEWLASSDKPSYWFFLKVSVGAMTDIMGGPGNVKGDIEYWVEDAFDAGLGTDAGSSFVTASRIAPGRYEGYLGVKGLLAGDASGNDEADYYKIHVKEGEKLLLKLTPESVTTLHLALYDQGRKKVKEASSSNPGAIITLSWTSPASQYVYIAVNRLGPFETITLEKPITKYTLSIETEDAL